MKISKISRRTFALRRADDVSVSRPRGEILRTVVAVSLAVALIGTGAVALPSLAPVEASIDGDGPPLKGPQLEPDLLADIESVHDQAGMLTPPLRDRVADAAKALPSAAVNAARATTTVAGPIADGIESIPVNVIRATAHEAIKMKRGLLPLIPSKFARAQNGVAIPVSLTQYCLQGETRRGRQTRHGIVAADPRIFPLSRYVEVFLDDEYLGRYLVDDTGGNVLGATLDIWNPNCKEAARFGRHWGTAVLVAREVEQVPNDSLTPTRWDGLAKR
ncbi:MAG: 3D domain-containing protein [Gemmatimonadaceae bacterium]